MPSEWYNGGDWDGLPIRRLAHVAADLVREADRKRDGSPMHPYSDDPADYDGWPVSRMAEVAEAALAWLRKECDDYAYPDFIEDVVPSVNLSAWAYVQEEDSTDIVTEEYLGIDGLTVDGQRMTGQIWHILRRAIERLRWQMIIQFGYPLDVKAPGSPWVANSVYQTTFSQPATDADDAAAVLNADLWPNAGAYTVDGASRAVQWDVTQALFSFGNVSAQVRGVLVRSKQSNLSYYDEVVRAGFAYDTQSPTLPASFKADGAGPYTDSGATRKAVWVGDKQATSTFVLDYDTGMPFSFSVSGGIVLPKAQTISTRIGLLFVRDMEYDPGS